MLIEPSASPLQETSSTSPSMETTNLSGSEMVTVHVDSLSFPSFTVTVYSPVPKLAIHLIPDSFSPPSILNSYSPTPPFAVTVNCPSSPPLQLTLLYSVISHTNASGSLIVISQVEVHPFSSSTVTSYSPAPNPSNTPDS